MKIYIAAWFHSRERLRPIVKAVTLQGHQVVSTWITAEKEGISFGTVDDTYRFACAVVDVGQVRSADMLILDEIEVSAGGGREVEFGIALANGIPCFLVGPQRNTFHQLAKLRFESWDECLDSLDALASIKN